MVCHKKEAIVSRNNFFFFAFFLFLIFYCSGKMARLSSLSSSQSVSFRHGNNVEFNAPGLQPPNGPMGGGGTVDPVLPLDGYNLQQITNKSRDFSNPMYDAVQAGANVNPSLGNGSGTFN